MIRKLPLRESEGAVIVALFNHANIGGDEMAKRQYGGAGRGWTDRSGDFPEAGRGQRPVGCLFPGCDREVSARGYCHKHYMHFYRRVETETKRDGRQKHPLFLSWRTQKYQGTLCEEWRDFWAFAGGVGERPSPHHVLRRKTRAAPIGPENFQWCAPVRDSVTRHDGTVELLPSSHVLAYKKERRRRLLLEEYGLSPEQYAALLVEQGGGCAICGRTESPRRRKRDAVGLEVDHDHATGVHRGILCGPCNRGIGQFADDLRLVEAAAVYLRKYAQAPHPEEQESAA